MSFDERPVPTHSTEPEDHSSAPAAPLPKDPFDDLEYLRRHAGSLEPDWSSFGDGFGGWCIGECR